MKKYRIIKKQNFEFRSKIYPEIYIVEVKSFIFWTNLLWFSGTDIDEENFWFHDNQYYGKSRPMPYHETEKKFGTNSLYPCCRSIIISENYDAIKFFVEKVIELNNYIESQNKFEKGLKEKTTDIIYVEHKEEQKQEELKQETKSNIIIDL